MMQHLHFAAVGEPELNGLLEGRLVIPGVPWRGGGGVTRIAQGEFGVLFRQQAHHPDVAQPFVIVAREETYRRLLGRLAQIRSDLSPLTAWCHLITPNRFDALDDAGREADLGAYEAMWCGLVVAEALLLSELPISKLKIAACLSTQSFAVGRSRALWGVHSREALQKYDAAQQMFRPRETRITKLRSLLEPIWSSIAEASSETPANNSSLAPLVYAVRALRNARQSGNLDEGFQFSLQLKSIVPDLEVFSRLPQLGPEQRVREFDRLVSRLNETPSSDVLLRNSIAMLAGYLSTVVAGGAASLSLLEPHSQKFPEMMLWAYALGGVGERVVWTSSFDGLGRLIARELLRPVRFDEQPTCDFSLDEAAALFDPHLAEPTVHLRIKQSRAATVGLLPGVNIAVPLSDQVIEGRQDGLIARDRSRDEIDRRSPESLDLIAEAVFQRLRGRIESLMEGVVARDSERSRLSKKSSGQPKLPFRGSK